MDANLPIGAQGALRGLMEEYGWEDAGEMQCKIEGKGEEPGATFSQSGDFEKEKGLTRIDTILLNAQARTMFHRFWMTEEGKLQHKQLHVQLKCSRYDAPIKVFTPPAPYPVETMISMSKEEEDALAESIEGEHKEKIEKKLEETDFDK